MSLQITRVLALQGAITMVIAGGTIAWGVASHAVAAILGGAAAAAAALAYGTAFWLQGAERSRKPLRTFLVAETCRVGAAVVLLIVGMASLPGEAAIVYLGAFIAALMAYLLVALF